MFLTITLALVTLLVYAVIQYYRYVARYPKGETPLPFIGNYGELDFVRQHVGFERLSKKFNGVTTVFTPSPIVHLRDFEVIKEAFIDKGDDFIGRPQNKLFEFFSFAPNGGVINSVGDNWREQRRAALSILRDFGMGKNVQETLVQSAVADMIEYLEEMDDKSKVDLHWPIQVMVVNVINEIMFGFRHKYSASGPLLKFLIARVFASKLMFIGMSFPFLIDIPFIGWHVQQFVVDNIHRALDNYSTDEEPSCFAQAYKQRMITNKNLDEPNLYACSSDFFLAGVETTTLRWAMLFMARYQDVQERLRCEIHTVVGINRLPSLNDQNNLPYTRACVLEVQRFGNVLSNNVYRETGQSIPAGTMVNADIHHVMAHDPLFVEPEKFAPDRYISEDGKTLKKDLIDRTIPFSIGKRACAGESLAKVELILCLASMVQHYRILPCEGDVIDLEPIALGMLRPKDQNVRLEKAF
ncbi:hypothetical protein PRIPAC_78095 [Pristionchus pacificus]|uniref:Cytochrome P450 n=1 Tax=Pristionchus pacificus TaxID=54126 RepID=A0A2A6CM17_PRIPA|nr:hypothetical protein PRIPAC_78095 [Pristionchus pacificus]|eukprot:PDM79138.1 cytochrome P450 [Pristionchus pacificus]